MCAKIVKYKNYRKRATDNDIGSFTILRVDKNTEI